MSDVLVELDQARQVFEDVMPTGQEGGHEGDQDGQHEEQEAPDHRPAQTGLFERLLGFFRIVHMAILHLSPKDRLSPEARRGSVRHSC